MERLAASMRGRGPAVRAFALAAVLLLSASALTRQGDVGRGADEARAEYAPAGMAGQPAADAAALSRAVRVMTEQEKRCRQSRACPLQASCPPCEP